VSTLAANKSRPESPDQEFSLKGNKLTLGVIVGVATVALGYLIAGLAGFFTLKGDVRVQDQRVTQHDAALAEQRGDAKAAAEWRGRTDVTLSELKGEAKANAEFRVRVEAALANPNNRKPGN
jgi:hypothetical protein